MLAFAEEGGGVTRVIDAFCRLIEILIAAFLAVMVVMVFGNVVLRYAFNSGIIVFGGSVALAVPLGDLPRRGRRAHEHVTSAATSLISRLPVAGQENLPRARPSADALCHLAGVLRALAQARINLHVEAPVDRGFDGLRLRHGRGVRSVRGRCCCCAICGAS